MTTTSKSKVDPFDVFVNAWGYHAASCVLDRRPEKNVFAWPVTVTGVLSIELFLKCLLHVRKYKSSLHTHKLRKLYEMLSKADQRRIRVRLRKIIKIHPLKGEMRRQRVLLDIDSILARTSDVFETQRYWHEKPPLARDSRKSASMAGIEPLANALLALLLDIRPEWRQRFGEFTASTTFVKYTPMPKSPRL